MTSSTVIAFDPGAERMGWAVLKGGDGTPEYIGSGVIRVPREEEKYQPYRARVIRTVSMQVDLLFTKYDPDYIVSELVPPVGSGAFGGGSMQAQLAASAGAAMMSVAHVRAYVVKQVAAVTAKKTLTGNAKATKVKVRNAVIGHLPILAERKKDWVKEFEEPDALAVGLTDLGYKNVDGST